MLNLNLIDYEYQYVVNNYWVLRCLEFYNFFLPDVSQDCMLPLFVMVASFWMVFWEYKTCFLCLSVAEGTDVVVNLIADDVWGSEDELTGALSDKFESWY